MLAKADIIILGLHCPHVPIHLGGSTKIQMSWEVL